MSTALHLTSLTPQKQTQKVRQKGARKSIQLHLRTLGNNKNEVWTQVLFLMFLISAEKWGENAEKTVLFVYVEDLHMLKRFM